MNVRPRERVVEAGAHVDPPRLIARKLVREMPAERCAAPAPAHAEPVARVPAPPLTLSSAGRGSEAQHPPSATLGQTMRSRRVELGLTQDDVAERASIAKSYISQIENGVRRSPPSEPILRRLERALALGAGTLVELGRWEATPASVKRLVRDIDGRASELAEALRRAAAGGMGGAGGAGRTSLDELLRTGVLARIAGGSPRTDRAEAEPARALAQQATARRVPIINRVAAGAPAAYTDLDHPARFADEYVDAPAPPVDDPDLFAARVTGDSMSPEYRDGDIVIFSPVVTVADGMDCFARLEPYHESTFKRVYFERAEPGTEGEGENGESLSGEMVRLQPLNPAHSVRVVPRERVAGLYAAVSVVRRIPLIAEGGQGRRTLHCASAGS